MRVPLALVAVALLVASLAFLLIESRSVKDDYYLSHAERTRVIETSRADIGSVMAAARDAYSRGSAFASAEVVALERIEDGNTVLQSRADLPRSTRELDSGLAAYDIRARDFVANGRRYAAEQDRLADGLQALQDQSPLLVRYLREQGLNTQAQRSFSLTIDILEFASGKGIGEVAPLELRVNELRSDASIVPETVLQVRNFADLADEVIARHTQSAAALTDLLASDPGEQLGALSQTLAAHNNDTVDRAERARSLLALCAVMLLLAAAFAVWRLQASYRALNAVNAGLEESVQQRTEQLSNAYQDLKESQVQLIHAEKMSSLGEMVAGISHEINTPLWYLINNASVIQERLAAVDELCEVNAAMLTSVRSQQSVRESLSHGLREIDRLMENGMRDDIDEARSLVQDSIDGLEDLTQLAQGLKDFSRLDRAAQDEFNVNEGIERTLLIAKNKIKHKANVQKHLGDLPDIVCSPSQINQVFLNLLTNAADAIEGFGDIVIHTSVQDGRVEISIADTGCGIAPDMLARIRDPFFTTKDVGQGTGLGLAIADRIVAQHHGELHIDSAPGKGTTVTVVLPIGGSAPDALRDDAAVGTPDPVDVDVAVMAGHANAAPATGGLPA